VHHVRKGQKGDLQQRVNSKSFIDNAANLPANVSSAFDSLRPDEETMPQSGRFRAFGTRISAGDGC